MQSKTSKIFHKGALGRVRWAGSEGHDSVWITAMVHDKYVQNIIYMLIKQADVKQAIREITKKTHKKIL